MVASNFASSSSTRSVSALSVDDGGLLPGSRKGRENSS